MSFQNCFEIHLDEESELRNNLGHTKCLLQLWIIGIISEKIQSCDMDSKPSNCHESIVETSSNQLPTLEDRYICYFAEWFYWS